jgi:hypothetical protein
MYIYNNLLLCWNQPVIVAFWTQRHHLISHLEGAHCTASAKKGPLGPLGPLPSSTVHKRITCWRTIHVLQSSVSIMSEIEGPRVLAMQQDHHYLRWALDSLWLKHIYRRVMKVMETAKRGRGTARGRSPTWRAGSLVCRWLLVGRWLVIEFLKHLIPSGSFVCHVMLVPSDFQAISPSILVQHISNVAGNE